MGLMAIVCEECGKSVVTDNYTEEDGTFTIVCPACGAPNARDVGMLVQAATIIGGRITPIDVTSS